MKPRADFYACVNCLLCWLHCPDAAVLVDGEVHQTEEEMVVAAETRMLRLTAAPLRGPHHRVTHAILLIEDITLPKRLERQMLLTERLTTAGRLVAGVAHEINNPLATIAWWTRSPRSNDRMKSDPADFASGPFCHNQRGSYPRATMATLRRENSPATMSR